MPGPLDAQPPSVQGLSHERSTEAEEAREEGAAKIAEGAARRQGREEEGSQLAIWRRRLGPVEKLHELGPVDRDVERRQRRLQVRGATRPDDDR